MLVTTNMGKKTHKTNTGSTIAQQSGEELQFTRYPSPITHHRFSAPDYVFNPTNSMKLMIGS